MADIFVKKEYGVFNSDNLVAFRDGKIISDCKLDETDFASKKAENGMLLVADVFNKTLKLPADNTAENIVIVNSEIQDYDNKGDASFALESGAGKVKPRAMGLEPIFDNFTTNAFVFDSAVYADFATLVAAIDESTVFGEPDATGFIRIVATQTAGTVTKLKVLGKKTLPNGEIGLEFAVL